MALFGDGRGDRGAHAEIRGLGPTSTTFIAIIILTLLTITALGSDAFTYRDDPR